LKKKNSGPSPRSVDRARVAGPRVHRGPHSGWRPEFTGAQPSYRSTAWWLAIEAREASRRRGDPRGWLTSDGGAVRRTSDGGERSSATAIGVERLGVRIEGRRGAASMVWRGRGGGAFYRAGRWWRGGEEAGGGGVLIPVGFE
jgi:hypothetical protein